MDPTPLLPYLVGLIPILIARSWQARIVAILFGAASIGLGVLYIWRLQHSPDSLAEVKMIAPVVIDSMCLSVVSLFVTFYVDKKYIKKP
ncbi:MAG TPA: hypothetical protein VGO59_15680 [Verrucomicrobiae bacterium]|jgi:hypothetical protein